MANVTFTSSGRTYEWRGNYSGWFSSEELFGTITEGDTRIILGRLFYAKISFHYDHGLSSIKRLKNKLITIGWVPVNNDMLFTDLESNRKEFLKKLVSL